MYTKITRAQTEARTKATHSTRARFTLPSVEQKFQTPVVSRYFKYIDNEDTWKIVEIFANSMLGRKSEITDLFNFSYKLHIPHQYSLSMYVDIYFKIC